MSNPSTSGERTPEPGDEEGEGNRTLEDLDLTFPESVRKAGFWSAIVLPVLYVPILVRGLSTSLEAGLFLALISLHLAALYVGHTYCR